MCSSYWNIFCYRCRPSGKITGKRTLKLETSESVKRLLLVPLRTGQSSRISASHDTLFSVYIGEIRPSNPMIRQRPLWLVVGVISARQSKPAANIWDEGLARRD